MKSGVSNIGRAARASAAANSKTIRLKVSVVKVFGRYGVARREILKRAASIAGAIDSAPLELISLVTFLFSDKKVTYNHRTQKFVHRAC